MYSHDMELELSESDLPELVKCAEFSLSEIYGPRMMVHFEKCGDLYAGYILDAQEKMSTTWRFADINRANTVETAVSFAIDSYDDSNWIDVRDLPDYWHEAILAEAERRAPGLARNGLAIVIHARESALSTPGAVATASDVSDMINSALNRVDKRKSGLDD